MDVLVVDVDGLVGAHRQRLAQRVLGVVRAHGHDGDLGVVGLLGDAQGLLDRVLVQLGEQAVDGLTVGRQVVGETAVAGRVGDVLHTDSDLQGHGLSPFNEIAITGGCGP